MECRQIRNKQILLPLLLLLLPFDFCMGFASQVYNSQFFFPHLTSRHLFDAALSLSYAEPVLKNIFSLSYDEPGSLPLRPRTTVLNTFLEELLPLLLMSSGILGK